MNNLLSIISEGLAGRLPAPAGKAQSEDMGTAPGWPSHRKSMLTARPLECAVRINKLGMALQSPVIDYITRGNL